MNGPSTLLVGAVLGGLAVALGAFGAHWLRDAVTQWGLEAVEQTRRLEVWETAVRYQMYHALALVVLGVWMQRYPELGFLNYAAWFFLIGVAIFSGLLYALVITGVKVLGAIVPIGGVALIIGWTMLAIAAWKMTRS